MSATSTSTSDALKQSQIKQIEAMSARRIDKESFEFNGWRIDVTKSPILPSNCYCHQQSSVQFQGGEIIDQRRNSGSRKEPVCQFCRYSNELSLKHLPEMVFPDNVLRLVYHESGFILEFTTFEALKLVNSSTSSSISVACSESWKASKADSGLPTNEVLSPFDWTYSTNYQGSIRYENTENIPDVILNSNEKLDLEKLKQRENILFYQELQLYEDELHDNGVSNLSVKIRVMASGFFILLRFFLRIDHVLIKLCDTRIHYEVDNDYFLRQFQVREENYSVLTHLEPQVFTDPNILYSHIPIISETNEKILIVKRS